MALYRLLDALVDSMFPYMAAMDDRIDELEDQIFENPKEEQLAALFALKRELVDMRKLVTPQRDMVSSMLTGVVPIPGMTRGGRTVRPGPVRPPDPDQRHGGQLP